MAVKLGIKGLKSSLDAMQCKRSPPTDSCSEYDPNSDSELEGDLSQCSSLVEESEADALSYSPIKVLHYCRMLLTRHYDQRPSKKPCAM